MKRAVPLWIRQYIALIALEESNGTVCIEFPGCFETGIVRRNDFIVPFGSFCVCSIIFENEDSANGYVPSTADRKYLALLSANNKDDYRMMRCDAAEEGYN